MHVLMLVYIEIFIRHVFAFLFLLSHQEFIYDDFLSVLVGSYTSINKLDNFSDIFIFDDVRHDMRHYLQDFLEIFLLILNDSGLKQLNQVSLYQLSIGNVFLFCIKWPNQAIQLSSHFTDFTCEEFFESIYAITFIKLEIGE